MSATSEQCFCEPDLYGNTKYNQFIGTVFGECLFTGTDYIPFILGIISVSCWVVALMPQLIMNYRRKECEAVNPLFITVWLLGDIFSLLGGLLLGQRTTAIVQGSYFILNDIVLLGQMFYYARIYKGNRLPTQTSTSTTNPTKVAFAAVFMSAGALSLFGLSSSVAADSSSSRSLLQALNLCDASATLSVWQLSAGSVVAWISGLLYFFSRVPQVWSNYKKQSCDGLAIGMFITAIVANTAFGSQFIAARVLNSYKMIPMDWSAFAAEELPYIIGSLGTLVYDFIIIYQFKSYGAQAKQ